MGKAALLMVAIMLAGCYSPPAESGPEVPGFPDPPYQVHATSFPHSPTPIASLEETDRADCANDPTFLAGDEPAPGFVNMDSLSYTFPQIDAGVVYWREIVPVNGSPLQLRAYCIETGRAIVIHESSGYLVDAFSTANGVVAYQVGAGCTPTLHTWRMGEDPHHIPLLLPRLEEDWPPCIHGRLAGFDGRHILSTYGWNWGWTHLFHHDAERSDFGSLILSVAPFEHECVEDDTQERHIVDATLTSDAIVVMVLHPTIEYPCRGELLSIAANGTIESLRFVETVRGVSGLVAEGDLVSWGVTGYGGELECVIYLHNRLTGDLQTFRGAECLRFPSLHGPWLGLGACRFYHADLDREWLVPKRLLESEHPVLCRGPAATDGTSFVLAVQGPGVKTQLRVGPMPDW